MAEVSCRVFGVVLDGLEARGIDPDLLVEGFPVTIEKLADSRDRVPWELFSMLMERLETICGGSKALEQIGYDHLGTESYAFMRRIAAFFAEPRDLYWLGTVWFGRGLFNIVEDEFEDLPNGRVREELRIPDSYAPCPQLFHIICGALRATPTLVGLGDAEVEAEIEPHHAVFVITPPVPSKSLRRAFRAIRHSMNARPLIQQLSEQQNELRRSNTELNQVLRALRESEERHRFFSELGSDLCYEVRLGPDDVVSIDWIRGAFESITGYSPEEIGQDWRCVIHPDDADEVDAQLVEALAGHMRRLEYRLVTKQGESLWVSGAIRATRDAATGSIRVFGSMQDITARKRAEQAHKRLVTAVDQAGEGIVVLDEQGHVLYSNPAFAELMGRPRHQIVGSHIDSLKFAPTDDALLDEMRETLLSGRAFEGRYTTRHHNGNELVRDATVVAVRDEANRVQGFVGILRDITREVEAEEEHLRAQRMDALGRLVGGLAHDFNNVLTVIEGYCEMLLGQEQADAISREALDMIQEAAERGTQLIRRLLAFSREQQMDVRPHDLNLLVQEVASILPKVVGDDIQLEFDLGSNLDKVRADPSCIEQVLLSLAINARDSMATAGGTLRIETRSTTLSAEAAPSLGLDPGEYATIAISDTGVGMSEDVRSRVFEPFFTTKEVGKGSGLGLSSAFGVIRQTGGQIQVRSEAGQGSVFTVYLPIAESVPKDGLAPHSEIGTPIGASRVLLVERDDVIRAVARASLIDRGYCVSEARSPQEALTLVARSEIAVDLLLMAIDPRHPEDADLRAAVEAFHPGISVLYLADLGSFENEPLRGDARALDVLSKSFPPSELVARVGVALDSVRLARAAASVHGSTTDPE